jgi:hypothetical protein
MQESQPIEKPRSELPIEQQANFEGSWTNLMIERLRDPEIRKQVIDLLVYEAENSLGDATGKYRERRNDAGEILKDSNGEARLFVEYGVPKTREQLEEEFKKVLEDVSKNTPISFGTVMPNAAGVVGRDEEVKLNGGEKYDEKREVINLEWVFPITGKKLTDKQLNIAESHEKGHVVRRYNRKVDASDCGSGSAYCLSEKFWRAFDFFAMQFPNSYYDRYREEAEQRGMGFMALRTNESLNNEFTQYLKSPSELAERMSQLKNYFGISGTTPFTKDHLAYAREHYVNDTDFNNEMTQFFQAITPEKEDAFIELINSAGI